MNIEAWRPHRRLAGHESDVVDLAWSTDAEDSYIATVGLDSRVIVWSGPREGAGGGGFERVKVINGHQGFVKGVVWDPIGEYLATASDDKTFKFWRVGGDWDLVKTVTKPFAASPSSTFFRRPSWSPEGAHVLSANAMSGPVFVASVIGRENWSTDIHLVGHENSVAVTAFSPRLFHDRVDKEVVVTVMALGSLDQSVSVWITGQARPILVARDVFQRQVMDLSWWVRQCQHLPRYRFLFADRSLIVNLIRSSDGLTLYACSADGHIAAFSFTPDELLRPTSDAMLQNSRETYNYTERQRLFRQSKNVRQLTNGISGGSHGTQNRPNMLVARKPGVPRAPTSGVAPPPANARSQRLDQQITRTSDGKRRIRPTLLDGGSDMSYSYDSTAASAQSVPAVESVFKEPAPPSPFGAAAEDLRSPSQLSPPRGAKRTASMSFPDGMEPESPAPSGKRIKDVGRTLGGDVQREKAGPSVALRTSDTGAAPRLLSNDVATRSALLPMPPVLNVYKVEETFGTIEVRNFDTSRPSEIYYIEPSTSKSIWMDFSSVGAHLATLTDTFSAVAFEDGCLAIYSGKGRRTSTLQLDAPCSRLESCGSFLVAILINGELRRWNTRTDSELGRPLYVLPLFASSAGLLEQDEFVHFWVHTNGLPVIMMRSEHAYTLDTSKNAWVLLCSGWYADCSPIWEGRTRGRGASLDSISGGGLSQTRRDPVRAIESEINDLVVIQRQVTGIMPARKPPQDRMNEFNATVMLKHLETRIMAAALLESPHEYKAHLLSYARKLSDEGIRNQAEDLCRSLLGPVYYNPAATEQPSSTWKPSVCGLSKRTLLHDVLRILSKGHLLLGLHGTYQELLRNVNNETY